MRGIARIDPRRSITAARVAMGIPLTVAGWAQLAGGIGDPS